MREILLEHAFNTHTFGEKPCTTLRFGSVVRLEIFDLYFDPDPAAATLRSQLQVRGVWPCGAVPAWSVSKPFGAVCFGFHPFTDPQRGCGIDEQGVQVPVAGD